MHNPLYSVAGLHKKVVLCTGKQPCLFLGNGSESWGSHLYQTGCCDGMDRIPLKRLQRQMLLWKYDFSTVHEEQEKYRWKGVLWGLLRWCPAMEYCVFCWNSRDSFWNPVKEFRCTPAVRGQTHKHGTDRDTFTNLLTDFILIYEFLFPRTYSIFISYIYLFWEYIFTGMR